MARTTTYYGLNISEGTDPVNPLVDIFPNFEDLDSDLKDVSDAAVGTATELTTGTVHALTRSDTDRDVFLFVATSNYDAGETFTLDGVQVTALTPDGQPLASGSYVIGSVVLCAVQSTLLTVYVNPAKAKDSDKLDGQHGSYYATASDVTDLGDTVTAISNKVGSAVLTTTAPDCSGAINELNSNLSHKGDCVVLCNRQTSGSNIELADSVANYKLINIMLYSGQLVLASTLIPNDLYSANIPYRVMYDTNALADVTLVDNTHATVSLVGSGVYCLVYGIK